MNRFKYTLTHEDCLDLYEYVEHGGDTPTFIYEAYMEDMPYGTQKCRTGDPDNWLCDRMDMIQDDFDEEISKGKELYEANLPKK